MEFLEEEKYKKCFGIYRIKNKINGKEYIGQTSENFQRRFWHHCFKLRNGDHDNEYLQSSFNKYGEENFVFEIVEVVTDKAILDEKEIFYIAESKKSGLSYNMLDGGGGRRGFKMRESTKKLIGGKNKISMTGKHHSEETKKKMGAMRSGKNSYLYKKLSDEDKSLIRNIKERLIIEESPVNIAKTLNVDYKFVNNILSNNAWKEIKVDGWDEFQKTRKKQKSLTLDFLKEVHDLFMNGCSKKELSERYGRCERTIRDWIRRYEEISLA